MHQRLCGYAEPRLGVRVLVLGGESHVVVPARDCFSGIRDSDDRKRCDDYVGRASETVNLEHEH